VVWVSFSAAGCPLQMEIWLQQTLVKRAIFSSPFAGEMEEIRVLCFYNCQSPSSRHCRCSNFDLGTEANIPQFMEALPISYAAYLDLNNGDFWLRRLERGQVRSSFRDLHHWLPIRHPHLWQIHQQYTESLCPSRC
jgi:hypothetical protein